MAAGCRPTTAPTSTHPSISPRPWTAASARSPSTRCRWTGASSPASSSISATSTTAMSPRPRDVEAELTRIGHELAPLEIVLVNTAAGTRLRPARLCRARLRHGAGGHALSAGTRRPGDRHRRLELGRAVRAYPRAVLRGDRRRRAGLGGPQGRPRDRLLPHREAAQSGGAAADRLHGELPSGQDRARFGRLDRVPWRSSAELQRRPSAIQENGCVAPGPDLLSGTGLPPFSETTTWTS